jgi:hypothetical protein
MHFYIKSKEPTVDKEMKAATDKRYTMENPAFRRAYNEAMERYGNTDLRKLSPERRLAIKQMRFQGKTPELIAKSRAIREIMVEEVNK